MSLPPVFCELRITTEVDPDVWAVRVAPLNLDLRSDFFSEAASLSVAGVLLGLCFSSAHEASYCLVVCFVHFSVFLFWTLPVSPGRVVGLFPADEICIRDRLIRVYTFLHLFFRKFTENAGTIDL